MVTNGAHEGSQEPPRTCAGCYTVEVMDRRDANGQDGPPARLDGRRETDPRLTTTDCAKRLGVSTGFIVGEILEGRLRALVLKRAGRRSMYRIAPADIRAYIRQHRWSRSDREAS